jgi:hypothetical protein
MLCLLVALGACGPATPRDAAIGQPPMPTLPPAAALIETPFPSFPLPDGDPPPLGRAAVETGFFEPLPRSPVWNPPGPKRVGIQVGHWQIDDLPHELRELTEGSSVAGWDEWEVNLLVAFAARDALEEAGVEVDLLPAIVPIRYRAHAFVAIHADGDWGSFRTGYKVARSLMSSVPEADDELVRLLETEYGAATGMLPDDETRIGGDMTEYYAFNARRYQHAIDLGTPAAIIELGYLTNWNDRALLTSRPDLAGRGIAQGVLRFLERDR